MKYKISGEPEIRNGEYGEYKVADLIGPAGETYERVFFGSRGAGYKNVYKGGEIEGEIDSSGRGPKFVFPRAGGFAKKDPKEEERRSKRIAFLASTERALEVIAFMPEKPTTGEAMRKTIVGWRDWFISEVDNYDNKIK